MTRLDALERVRNASESVQEAKAIWLRTRSQIDLGVLWAREEALSAALRDCPRRADDVEGVSNT